MAPSPAGACARSSWPRNRRYGGQLRGRRDGHDLHRHQRGQRQAGHERPSSPRRRDGHREGDPEVRGPLDVRAAPGEEWDGTEDHRLHQLITGPRAEGELDGAEELHLILMDNGRSRLLGTEFEEALYCIRCGACLNVCPVYRQTGGHAYGSTYSGPIGAVITPLLKGTRGQGPAPRLEPVRRVPGGLSGRHSPARPPLEAPQPAVKRASRARPRRSPSRVSRAR